MTRVAELLEHSYRSADLGNLQNVLDEAVYILLSLKTREAVYKRVFADLRRMFPRWDDVVDAPDRELERVLAPGGLQVQKTGHLRALLAKVRSDNMDRRMGPAVGGDLTLEYLHEMHDDELERFLLGLPGVGTKSARCIMAYSLGRSTFAVDTHVERIFTRLGLVDAKEQSTVKVDHDTFQAVVDPALRKQLHMNLIHHGRRVCQSKAQCSACVLVSFCSDGRRLVGDDGQPVAIDLFGGSGGLGSGFRSQGYRIALAVELDRNSAQTYRLNNPGVPVIEGDVTRLTPSDVRALCPGVRVPDVVLAGPPCQGYSTAGSRDPKDAKNKLYMSVVRLAEGLRARLVVMENVPGLQRVSGVQFTDRILRRMRKAYRADCHPLVASDFGVPQHRRRLFFVGRRKDLGPAPSAPHATHVRPGAPPQSGLGRTPRLEERLRGPLEFAAGAEAERLELADGTVLFNASTMRHSADVVAKIKKMKAGKGPISYRRLERDVARTLVAGHRALPVHPWLHRTISVREAARIQGFGEDYLFCGPRSAQPLQVANAVPPPVAAAIAAHLRPLLPSRRRRTSKGPIRDGGGPSTQVPVAHSR